jgi:hypothetical protein
MDREGFKKFADNLWSHIGQWSEVCITGYFSETVRDELERYARFHGYKLRLICQELDVNNKRDRKNLEVLRKLCKSGTEIKVNNRLHARFLVAYHPQFKETRGLLIIGSFDFNTECMGKERYDAGIKTTHPDLIQSALKLFEEIWNDTESTPFSEKYPQEPKSKTT